MGFLAFLPWASRHLGHDRRDADLARGLAAYGGRPAAEVLAELGSAAEGLDPAVAERRLAETGLNLVAHEARASMLRELAGRAKNPLNALLLTLAGMSWFLGDARAASVIAGMVVLSIGLAFIQEHRSNNAAAALRAMVRNTATVRRGGLAVEIPLEKVVPADLRLLHAKDLFINQAALTGEGMPVEKSESGNGGRDPFAQPDICFMGSNVVCGAAVGVVVHTGPKSYFGQLARDVVGLKAETSFDRGIARFTWLMMRFMAVMVPTVFVVNGVSKGDWLQALLFALAVAVGLTPEMLPMIVTVNLAKGALAMSRRKVIVKRLNAIQNFGAMNVLCTDKTGTLTQDRIILKKHLDIAGEESRRVLEFAYLNSFFQSGLKNLLDHAVLDHVELREHLDLDAALDKVDEIPFDFTRRRMSVVVRRGGKHQLICKGAVEEMFQVCTRYELNGEIGELDAGHFAAAQAETRALNADGFRVVAVAYRDFDAPPAVYGVSDEAGLTLLGYVAFLDPPKDSAGPAIAALERAGVAVKIVTGDNDVVTAKICREVGIDPERMLLGAQIEAMSDEQFAAAVEGISVFAKVSPAQKARVIDALHRRGNVVGFLGDGINDGPALKAADVGISVDTAVDIAKESADIILLEKSLTVLGEGVLEGRRIFGNIIKYIKMGASSNFGNMFSVLGPSIFLPFLPMAPIQVLTNNLLYDFSQTTIPTDRVDEDYLLKPRKWDISNLTWFMLCLGPISSIYDYVTFYVMIRVFGAWDNPALFQTGWFVESILTQTLIIHIIRTARIPFIESRASWPLIATTIVICAIAVWLPFSPIAGALGFVALPPLYWPIVAATLLGYATLAHLVKSWFVRRWGM